jgi:hypothetical protein
MREIDVQRITAVRTLRMMGYVFCEGEWVMSPTANAITAGADRLHAILIQRADELVGCTWGWPQADERAATAALDAYEDVRWPDGKVPGGKD